MWKISSPTEVKNHDLPLIEFSHTSLNDLITLTVTTCNTHSHVIFFPKIGYPTSKFPQLWHTELTYKREENTMNTLLLCFSTQASVRYNKLLLCELQKLNFTHTWLGFLFWIKADKTIVFFLWKTDHQNNSGVLLK